MTPRGVANLDHRDMIGRIYVWYHLTLLHTKYTSLRLCGFGEDFKHLSYYKPMPDSDPQGVANFDPRVMIGRNYKGPY